MATAVRRLLDAACRDFRILAVLIGADERHPIATAARFFLRATPDIQFEYDYIWHCAGRTSAPTHPGASQGMAHIDGALYYETMGKRGPVMAFVHPNPMDQSCWIFQMAQMSTWYRCVAIDLPGYGRSPKARAGLTMQDIAQACWEAIDDAYPGERTV